MECSFVGQWPNVTVLKEERNIVGIIKENTNKKKSHSRYATQFFFFKAKRCHCQTIGTLRVRSAAAPMTEKKKIFPHLLSATLKMCFHPNPTTI